MPTAVVTGANRGIGLEWVRQLLDKGWDVHAGYRTDEGGLSGTSAHHHQLDVTSKESVEAFAASLPDRVDLLVNNAGVADGRWRSIEDIDHEQVLKVLDINSVGPVRVTQALLSRLGGDKMSTIAMVSSLMGSVEDCISGKSYAYRASKSALNMFSTAMKNELRDANISVVILHPGWVQTDMGGPNATVTPLDSIAGMIQRVEEQTLEITGRFVQYDGEALPW
ncbi:SDR family oxidoreductase [Deltaproteobacteria bacterium]|nr:SDR family oxidoreductase [Deltaproteobacteria bacterium]